MVRVNDLADQILNPDRAGEFLYEPETGAEYSGNKADYWYLPDEHEFKGLVLMTKHTEYQEVKNVMGAKLNLGG